MPHMSKEQAFVPLPGADESCALCTAQGGVLAWSDAHWRVVRVEDADFPAYYRVVANYHTTEFTDLSVMQRQRCIALVSGVERVLRDLLTPTKVNLAALGNQVPHLHWHVIARFAWDSHFPQPIWGARQREVKPVAASRLGSALPALDEAVARALVAVS
jgi:diadenosine tetraphosphate (Ap4A) HIT family hydrolase